MTSSSCTRHPTNPAVGACDSCGRDVCVGCAVPFRGELRCAGCAAREVGERNADEPTDPRPGWGMDRVAGMAFLGGVLVSLLPWDRIGSLSGFLAAWSPRPEVWPLVSGILLLLGAVTALRPAPLSLRSRLTYTGLGALAVAATLLAIPAPDFTVRNAVPYVVLAMAIAGTILGILRLRSPDREQPSP